MVFVKVAELMFVNQNTETKPLGEEIQVLFDWFLKGKCILRRVVKSTEESLKTELTEMGHQSPVVKLLQSYLKRYI